MANLQKGHPEALGKPPTSQHVKRLGSPPPGSGGRRHVGQALLRSLSRTVACSSTSQSPAWMTDPCATHTCSARNLFRVDSSVRTGACPTVTLTVHQKECTAQRHTAQASCAGVLRRRPEDAPPLARVLSNPRGGSHAGELREHGWAAGILQCGTGGSRGPD